MEFLIDGMRLQVPDAMLTPPLAEALASGRYEGKERRALATVLRPGDRLLDLGAGAGSVAISAARLLGAGAVTAVEAHPGMLKALRANLDANGAAEAKVIHAAAVPDDEAGPQAMFWMARAFWAASLASVAPDGVAAARMAAVPTRGIAGLVAEAEATVISMDIEGAEAAILCRPLPPAVRAVVMETHPGRYGPGEADRMGASLTGTGLCLLEGAGQGAVQVWARD